MDEVMMQIVVDERGRIIYDNDGRICLQSNDQNSDITEDASSSINGITRVDQNSDIMETSTEDASISNNGIARVDDIRAHWTRGNILRLISAYKEHHELFRSKSVKNSEAWRRVAADVPGFSIKQCEGKFKYLKSLYTKHKDNMGNNSSGARAIIFEYFEEFDEIFHQKPNIIPVVIASSSNIAEMEGHSNTTPTHEIVVGSPANLEESAIASTGRSRRKRTRLEIQLEKFQRNMELREQARERRMNRFLEQQQVCTDRICNMMQKFIEKL